MTARRQKLPAIDRGSLDMTTDAVVIETARHTAGIAVRERGGYRFYASDLLFYPLDNRSFRGLRELHVAIDRLAAPPAERARPSEG